MGADWLLPIYGLIVGMLVGLTGMGGGVLMTPLLVLGLGMPVNHKRVARLMREAGTWASTGAETAAARPGRRPRTTWYTASSPSTPRTGSG